MIKIGLEVPASDVAHTLAEAEAIRAKLSLPLIIRPSRTLGGTGGAIAREPEDFRTKVAFGLDMSPSTEVLIEESVEGWKEFELEVMRDTADNVVIICSIENLDAMGVHTGDSITVAPAQTLTDKEYQLMRDASLRIIREIGVDTGGSNIQFAIDPRTGRMVVIEMNPRVSRSSALASKATGFPIAKIAARLAVGYTLDEIPNDITKMTPSCFEPTIDYVVTKIPRFTFEKFRGAVDELGPQMKSVGEAMAIGRTFKESLQKALRSLEISSWGLESKVAGMSTEAAMAEVRARLKTPNSFRIYYLADALRLGVSREEIYHLSNIDPWFIDAIAEIIATEERARHDDLTPEFMRELKAMGFSDRRIADLRGADELTILNRRRELGITPVYKLVDTCGAEFPAFTPYYYSTYEGEDEAKPDATSRKIMILGGGPNRIGQGIEFDYCCVHASLALKAAGFETIMVNCNPETVSTDYDISDRLYFEPLTFEDVMAIVEREKPAGVIVQFGGQTPLKLAVPLSRGGRADSRHLARCDRSRRGSRALQSAGRQARTQAAQGRARARPRRCDRRRQHHRLSRLDSPFLCSRRPRDGGYPRRGQPAPLRRECAASQRAPSAADRSLPARRGRGRRRCDLRRRDGRHRRHHGARRARGHPFGRQRLRASAALAHRSRSRMRSRSRPRCWRASSASSASSTCSSRFSRARSTFWK